MTGNCRRLEKHREMAAKQQAGELARLFGDWVPLVNRFQAQRRRLYSPERTFWLFLSQVLCGDGSCREAVRQFLAWRALEGEPPVSPETGGYCTARQRLNKEDLEELHKEVVEGLRTAEPAEARWCGRTVKVVDGSSVSMPDTPENQARYPQPKNQKPGCGFPVMRIVALFSLSSGLLLDVKKGNLHVHERTLFKQMWGEMDAGDVILADRGFTGYADYYQLGQLGVDCVMRNHQRRTVGRVLVKQLGKGDRLVHWTKMKPCPKGWTKEDWDAVPDTLPIRELDLTVDVPGFRTKNLVIATTLLDPKQYPKQSLADLYLQRWMAEIYLRDIKTSMGMDILRCKTPDMVEKELCMHLIAYNLIRGLILKAAKNHHLAPQRLSFKGTVATARKWAPLLATVIDDAKRHHMTQALLDAIARDPVPHRPNRSEPRAIKRRPKNYQRLTKPRHQFKESPHRNKYVKP